MGTSILDAMAAVPVMEIMNAVAMAMDFLIGLPSVYIVKLVNGLKPAVVPCRPTCHDNEKYIRINYYLGTGTGVLLFVKFEMDEIENRNHLLLCMDAVSLEAG